MFDDKGAAHGVTVLSVGDCSVVGCRSMEKNGYVATVLGMREAKAKHIAKPQIVAAEKSGVKPYRKVVEFRVSEDCVIPAGTPMSAAHFIIGQYVDIQATSKGKGFQGAMKRHNFGGKEASHGVLKAHRSLGSTGMREWPGRVLKGKKMAGQMGNEAVTVQNLKVFDINAAENLIFIEGAVPGANGTFVLVADSVKKDQKDLPIPTVQEQAQETLKEEASAKAFSKQATESSVATEA